MRNIRLTNKQITEMCAEFRRQLKETKSRSGKIDLSYPLTTIKDGDKAEVIFTTTANKKLIALVDQCSKEIGWHGTVVRDPEKPNRFIIEDLFVFPQTVTAATVTPDETEYAMWLGGLDDETFNKLRFHGHSHVRMACNPSGVDTEYQDNILQNLKDFYIFGIFNKHGSNWMLIYDIENNILYEDKDIIYSCNESEEEVWAAEQIKELVKEPPKPTANTTYGAGRTYGSEHGGKATSGKYVPPAYGQTIAAGKKTPGEKMTQQMSLPLDDEDYPDDRRDVPGWYGQYCGY